jgi:hypothetical protein
MKNFNPTYIAAVPASTVWTINGPHKSTVTCAESEDGSVTCSVDLARDMKLVGNAGYIIENGASVKTLTAGMEEETVVEGGTSNWALLMTCKFYSDVADNFNGSNCDFAVTNSHTYEIETEYNKNITYTSHAEFVDGCGTGRDACFDPANIAYSKTMYGPEGFTLDCNADTQGLVLCHSDKLGDVEG